MKQVVCPKCGSQNEMPDHEDHYKCSVCGNKVDWRKTRQNIPLWKGIVVVILGATIAFVIWYAMQPQYQ